MRYTIRWMHTGRVHEAKAEDMAAAIMVFEALFDMGYRPELWQGANKVR